MKNKSRYKAGRRWLTFWTLFIGIGAVAGSTGMLVDPSGKSFGMDAMLPYFKVLPFSDILFQNLVFSGIALFIVNGLTNLIAFVLIMLNKRSGIILGGLFGVTLMLWICIQFYIFPMNFMSTIYFVFGLCQAITGYAAWVFSKQESFSFTIDDYSSIGSNPKRLVVYFSRMGYVKKQAYEAANKTGAEIYEIKTSDKTKGTSGFWWCGFYGMFRRAMPIEPVDVDLSSYEHVTICSSIWVFSIAAPVREFCKQASKKIKEVDYILLHHTRGKYNNAVIEMDKLLSIYHTGVKNIQCKQGKFKVLE